MEQLNKVQLRGIIGSVKLINIGDRKGARITVATNLAYRGGQGGSPVIETTWHNVTAWSGTNITNLDSLKKGDAVEIVGRLKNQHYVGSDGTDHSSVEILASSMKFVDENMKMEE